MESTETVEIHDFKVALKPLFTVMKICGIYYDPNESQKSTVSEFNDGKMSKFTRIKDMFHNYIWRAYTVFTLIILWIATIRVLLGMVWRYGDKEFAFKWSMYKIVTICYNLQAALEISLMYRMFHRSDRFHKFAKEWYEFSVEASTYGCPQWKVARDLRRVFTFYFVFLIIILVLLQVAYFGAMFGPLETVKDVVLVMVDPFPRTDFFKMLTGFILVLVETVWVITIVLFVSTAKALALQFKTLTTGLHAMIVKSPEKYPPDLSALRKAHLQLCDLVAINEQDFKHILAVAYTLNILISLLLLYNMVKREYDLVNLSINGFWLVCNIGKMHALSLSAAQLHDTAQEPLGALFKVIPKEITLEDAKNLDMFIQKLQETNIGFTVWDFMLVRRETILTIVGVFFTYFFILVQFNFPA